MINLNSEIDKLIKEYSKDKKGMLYHMPTDEFLRQYTSSVFELLSNFFKDTD